MTLTLIGMPKSRAFRPLWLLEELELDFDFRPDPPHSDTVKAANPRGKVPVLLVDGTAITDSTAIMTYLADREGKFAHAPGTLARARQDSLTQMIMDELDACLWMAARHSFILPEERRMPAIKDSLKWEFSRSVGHLSDVLGDGPFLTGETMTLPDIIAAHCGMWADLAGFPVEDVRFTAYLDRMRARPAFGRAARR